MKSPKLGIGIGIVVVVGLAAAVVALATVRDNAGGQAAAAMGPEASAGRSPKAVKAEAAIVRTDLIRRLQVALGDDFGGVWFDSPTAQLHIGVTSTESRRLAVALAERTGLEQTMTDTSVRSTWAELLAEQQRWNTQLSGMLTRGEVRTSLVPDENTISIELSSSVSVAKQTALEQRASVAGVDVSVTTTEQRHLGIVREAGCAKFKKDEAFCNPPIVGGVRIEDQGEKKVCSAGPAVLKQTSSAIIRTETFILTAGHCLKEGGSIGTKWFAFNKEGNPKGKKEIGEAVAIIDAKTDVGVIRVNNPGYWANAGYVPVDPTTAPWAEEEPEPISVFGETESTKGMSVCYSGQTTGTGCGEIEAVNVTYGEKEELVKVGGVTTQEGDSGGSWFVNGTPSVVVGTHVGKEEKGNGRFYQPLQSSFADLIKSAGMPLELLTVDNERRHPWILASEYPATLLAKDSSKDKFTAFGAVSCAQREFHGVLSEPKDEDAANTIEVTPNYSECTEGEGRAVKVTTNGCKYKVTLTERVEEDHYEGDLGLVCPEGKPGIEFEFFASHKDATNETNPCEMTMPPQEGLESLTLTNSEEKIVIDKGAVEGIKFQMQSDVCLCPGGVDGETTKGVYHLAEALTIEGEKEEGEVEIGMAGG